MRRPSVLAIVCGAAALLFVGWIAGNTEWGEVAIPTPLRGDAATNPFYAAQKLVETLGATSERRESLGDTQSDAVVVLSTWVGTSITRDEQSWSAGSRRAAASSWTPR